jgi:hypothetical protein
MRKIILALVVALIAAPAWASVTITATDLGEGVVAIDYDATGETELVRAFALDITVDAGVIADISEFKVGVSMAGDAGFGIFPANFSRYITVDPQSGNVDDWTPAGYTPVADGTDPGAQPGLGTAGITIEMGSLYDGDANKPGKQGHLCTLTVTENCTLSLAANATRGNILLENGEEAEVVLEGTNVVMDCYPAGCPSYNDWVRMGKPECWCGAKGNPPCPYQCDGDCDCSDSGIPFRFQVFTGDLACLVENWKKKIDDPTLNPCADFDHTDSGIPFKFRVFTSDLAILVTNWKKKAADLAADCPRCG